MTQHMNSKIVGQLSPTDYDPDFFESKPYPFPYFDDKEIKVGFVEAEHQPYLDGADVGFPFLVQFKSRIIYHFIVS